MFPSFVTSRPPGLQPSTNAKSTYTDVLQVGSMLVDTFSMNSAVGAPTTGKATLASGLKLVATTAINTGDLVFLSVDTIAGTPGAYHRVTTIVDGVSFQIEAVDSSDIIVSTDISVLNYMIVKPVA
jgi:hypothetical protein